MFNWNCHIFQRINRQIIRVTQTPLKSLCLLSRKKNIHASSEWDFTWKTYQTMGKFPILALHALPLQETRGCGRATPLGQWSAPWLAGWPALSPSYLQCPQILHSPPSLTGQPGCSSCMSGLSLGNSALFNYLASDGSDFSLFSWQPSRIHPSFSFSEKVWSSHSRGPAKSCPLNSWDERGSQQLLPGTAQHRGWELEQKICESWH